MHAPVFSLGHQLDPRHAQLIWDVFFVERSRGLDLARHFPWLGRDQECLYAGLRHDAHWLAGLCIRPIPLAAVNAAAIGLVCVSAGHRGNGLARQLIGETVAALDERGLDALTLWTGKPGVYRRQGFESEDSGVLIHIEGLEPAAAALHPADEPWPPASESRGLPPYALSGRCIGHGRARAIVLCDPLGDAVAEWQGSDAAVGELLAAAMPRQWRLHSTVDDTLPEALRARGARLRSEPSRLQMWRWRAGRRRCAMPTLRLLDRI
ncbi:MAG: GNAT family N-acetyltransferase [Proteobacteria bacterium]|jgi:GNAT superfamily N-acetyltransferase|nr:GNAT family N-acetyltransferase [Pseudomonadota bacterium]